MLVSVSIHVGLNLASGHLSLLTILFEFNCYLLEVVHLFVGREVLELMVPTYHVVMGFFKNSIIIDILHDMFWLNVLHDSLLLLDEVLEGAKLLLHVVLLLLEYLVNADKIMTVTKAHHLRVSIGMFRVTILTKGLLMSSAILGYFLIVVCTYSVLRGHWSQLHMSEGTM